MRGRIRTIKPEAFLDEGLWDLEDETGLPVFRAFFGLVCYADREGRFEWRPRPLKALILPYWDQPFSRVLDALATRGFVVKYASGDREYGVIPSFLDHQVVNNRELASVIPPPPGSPAIPGDSTRGTRDGDATATRQGKDLEEREGNGKGKGTGTRRADPAVATRESNAQALGADLSLIWNELRSRRGLVPEPGIRPHDRSRFAKWVVGIRPSLEAEVEEHPELPPLEAIARMVMVRFLDDPAPKHAREGHPFSFLLARAPVYYPGRAA